MDVWGRQTIKLACLLSSLASTVPASRCQAQHYSSYTWILSVHATTDMSCQCCSAWNAMQSNVTKSKITENKRIVTGWVQAKQTPQTMTGNWPIDAVYLNHEEIWLQVYSSLVITNIIVLKCRSINPTHSITHSHTVSNCNACLLTRSFSTSDFRLPLRRRRIAWRHACVAVRSLPYTFIALYRYLNEKS